MTERALRYGRAQLAATPDTSGPLTFTISSTRLNRHGFALRTDGWMLDDYNANPVVLWMHNPRQPPIGRGQALNKGDRVTADVTFDQEDEFARTIESKYRRGFLSAVSVGMEFVNEDGSPMDLLDFIRMSDEQIRDEAFYNLAELSGVTVPADPGALVEHQHARLSRISRELAGIYEEQEYGHAHARELQAAVRAELRRLGLAVGLSAISSHDTAVVDTEWDGSAAVADAPNDREVLRYMHAWVDDSGDPDEKQSYKLPHHAPGTDTPANLPAVRNALARLSQTEMPDEDRSAVERHLQNHLDAQQEQSHAPRGIDQDAAQAVQAAFKLGGTS